MLERRSNKMNEEILKEYYNQYSHLIYKRAIQIVRDEEDAMDIVQTVFYRIWKYGDKFKQRSEIFTWIYRITTNCAFDLLKKKAKQIREMQLDEAIVPDKKSEIHPADTQNPGDDVGFVKIPFSRSSLGCTDFRPAWPPRTHPTRFPAQTTD